MGELNSDSSHICKFDSQLPQIPQDCVTFLSIMYVKKYEHINLENDCYPSHHLHINIIFIRIFSKSCRSYICWNPDLQVHMAYLNIVHAAIYRFNMIKWLLYTFNFINKFILLRLSKKSLCLPCILLIQLYGRFTYIK